jgi:hypothetical protein
MQNSTSDLALARALSYLLFGSAGVLVGICAMLVHDRTKIEQERLYYSNSRYQLRIDSERECSSRIERLLARCRCTAVIR